MSKPIIQLSEETVKSELKESVRNSVEETLNELLNKEAEELTNASQLKGTSPDADLVNTMLDQAIAVLPPETKPIVHSDRGCHYRRPWWIRRMQAAGLRRSMSKK